MENRMKNCKIIAIVLTWMTALPVFAGTVIESVDGEKNHARIMIEKDMARIDAADMQGYMLIDLAKEKIYAVSTAEQGGMGLSPHAVKSTPRVITTNRRQASFIKQGKGPRIADYSTVYYKVMMGDTHCFDEYLSKEAVDNPDIRHFTEVMARISQSEATMTVIESSPLDNPCVTAEESMDDQYVKLGVPLRTVDENGVTVNEITQIQNEVSFSPDAFDMPTDYPMLSREEMMQRAMESVPSHGGGAAYENPHMGEDMSDMSPEDRQEIQDMQNRSREMMEKMKQD